MTSITFPPKTRHNEGHYGWTMGMPLRSKTPGSGGGGGFYVTPDYILDERLIPIGDHNGGFLAAI